MWTGNSALTTLIVMVQHSVSEIIHTIVAIHSTCTYCTCRCSASPTSSSYYYNNPPSSPPSYSYTPPSYSYTPYGGNGPYGNTGSTGSLGSGTNDSAGFHAGDWVSFTVCSPHNVFCCVHSRLWCMQLLGFRSEIVLVLTL